MKRLLPLFLMMSVALVSFGQDISVTFTGTGAATQIDSVTATNLSTGESVTIPGSATLFLTPKTGIPALMENAAHVMIFPNPFSGRAAILASVPEPQQCKVKVQNLVGQVIAQTETFLQPGDHRFDLSLTAAGIYLVSLTTDQGTTGYKVICTGASGSGNRIQYLSSDSGSHNNQSDPYLTCLKTFQSGYPLGFSAGEIIHYQCTSGVYVTIMTDSPAASKNYEVEFTACTDQDERNYPVVIIGDQTWMAGNLAWLPGVSPSSTGSIAEKHYYVYGQQGSSVSDAKASVNYTTYGVLYNWEAARWACPTGWHLPSDAEWTVLADYLGSSAGGKMMEAGTAHWSAANSGATNETGFRALPGGNRTAAGTFATLGDFTAFWSATEDDSLAAMSRNLKVNNSGFNRVRWNKKAGYSVRCLKGGVAINTPPTAGFNISIPNGTLSTSFQFDASTSMDDITPPSKLQVRWDWNGDGTWDTGFAQSKIISHQYTSLGSWSVILEVQDEGGLMDTETKTVIVGDSTFIDSRDGRHYYYRTIGTQNWIIVNLAYLPTVSPTSVGSDTAPFYYVYDYQGSNVAEVKATTKYATYGVLYNYDAAKNACPAGWHLPSDDEWSTLTKYLGPKAGGKMKEAGFTHWLSPNTGATNSSGFTALPGGFRYDDGSLRYIFTDTFFWTSTEDGASKAWDRALDNITDGVYRGSYNRNQAYSVRCVQD